MDTNPQECEKCVIDARNLTKVYRDFWGREKVRALKALDLDVRRGEIFGLLGPNGSGKTTTIKLLLGLLFPTSGEALVFGRPATDVAKNERLGYLPEESYLYRFLNAEETLDFYARLFNMSAAQRRERVNRLISEVKLDGARRRQLKEYSKGMTRRIGLAQAPLQRDGALVVGQGIADGQAEQDRQKLDRAAHHDQSKTGQGEKEIILRAHAALNAAQPGSQPQRQQHAQGNENLKCLRKSIHPVCPGEKHTAGSIGYCRCYQHHQRENHRSSLQQHRVRARQRKREKHHGHTRQGQFRRKQHNHVRHSVIPCMRGYSAQGTGQWRSRWSILHPMISSNGPGQKPIHKTGTARRTSRQISLRPRSLTVT